MCGRVTLDIDIQEMKEILERAFSVNQMSLDGYEKRYNIAPSQNVVSVINDGNENRAGYLSWGFIPPYVRDSGSFKRIINTRSETVDTKPSFRDAFTGKRCIILASSFYEWNSKSGVKTPYNIKITDQPLLPLAGIWSSYRNKDGNSLYTCSILTTGANAMMKHIHHRMPVILTKDAIGTWLNRSITDPADLKPLLMPYSSDTMTMYPVSTLVNNVRLDSEELIKPL